MKSRKIGIIRNRPIETPDCKQYWRFGLCCSERLCTALHEPGLGIQPPSLGEKTGKTEWEEEDRSQNGGRQTEVRMGGGRRNGEEDGMGEGRRNGRRKSEVRMGRKAVIANSNYIVVFSLLFLVYPFFFISVYLRQSAAKLRIFTLKSENGEECGMRRKTEGGEEDRRWRRREKHSDPWDYRIGCISSCFRYFSSPSSCNSQ